MARDRLLSSQERPGDQPVDAALRPKRLAEMVGQSAVLDKLRTAMSAAKKRGEPLEHILLDGPPGLGKTTLAHVIAKEMSDRPPRITSGPSLAKQADLMALLTNLETGELVAQATTDTGILRGVLNGVDLWIDTTQGFKLDPDGTTDYVAAPYNMDPYASPVVSLTTDFEGSTFVHIVPNPLASVSP